MLRLLWPNPAALVKSEKTKTLLIADPHIGWETSAPRKRHPCSKPNTQNPQQTNRNHCKYKPQQLVILGDVKYTVISSELGEWHDIPDFFTKLQEIVTDIASCPR